VSQVLGRRVIGALQQNSMWAPRAFAALLTVIATAEGLRIILTGADSEIRYGGWYLLVVAAALATGIFVREEMPDVSSVDSVEPEAEPISQPLLPEALPGAATAAVSQVGLDRDTPSQRVLLGRAVVLFAAAIAFAIAMPWIGFAPATLLFLLVYFRWISDIHWPRTTIYALITSFALVGGFALLSVRMPRGIFGLPF